MILSASELVTVDAWLEAKGYPVDKSGLAFLAEVYNGDQARLGSVQVRLLPNEELTQAQIQNARRADIGALSDGFRRLTENSLKAAGGRLVTWEDAELQDIGGLTAVVFSFVRDVAQFGEGAFRVRLARFYSGANSFSVTVSYSVASAPLLQPITARILTSVRRG
jgi:hypothetical protein